MPVERHRRTASRLGIGYRTAMGLSVSLITLLVAMPTASALAGSVPGGARAISSAGSPAAVPPPGGLNELLPEGELNNLLSGLPLGNLSIEQLVQYLATLPAIGTLTELPTGPLPLDKLGIGGLETGLEEAIEELGGTATLGDLTHPNGLLAKLEGRLGVLSTLLGPLLSPSQQKELETLDLDQVAGSLLAGAKESAQLEALSKLLDGVFGELGNPKKLEVEELLGSAPGPFESTTAGAVASELGTSTKAVSEDLGQGSEGVAATTKMLVAPLPEGKLGVAPAVAELNGLKGLALGLLGGSGGGASKEPSSGSGEGSGKGGSGSGEGGSKEPSSGSGESPDKGGNGLGEGDGNSDGQSSGESNSQSTGAPAGGTTLVVNLPSQIMPASRAATQGKAAKIKILSYRAKGQTVTIVVQAPAAGKVTISGNGVRTVVRKTGRAERITLELGLSKAGVASLRRLRNGLKVRLLASFKPTTGGNGSSAMTTVLLAR
jgi:hypothetical protein